MMLFHNWAAIYLRLLNWSFIDSSILQQLLTMKHSFAAERDEGKMRCSDESCGYKIAAVAPSRRRDALWEGNIDFPLCPRRDRVLRSIQLILVAHICRWKSAPRVSTFERLSLPAVDISPFSPTLRAVPFLSLPLRFPLALMSS